MRNGIAAGPLRPGLKYGDAIQRAGVATNCSPVLLYAIGSVETIGVEDWIASVWPGKNACTVVTGTGTTDDPFGYGMFQETPAASGLSLPANWEDPFTAACFAVNNHIVKAEEYWARYAQGDDLVRCIAAEYNVGRSGAQSGHEEGDVGKYTSLAPDANGVERNYADRALAVYTSLAVLA